MQGASQGKGSCAWGPLPRHRGLPAGRGWHPCVEKCLPAYGKPIYSIIKNACRTCHKPCITAALDMAEIGKKVLSRARGPLPRHRVLPAGSGWHPCVAQGLPFDLSPASLSCLKAVPRQAGSKSGQGAQRSRPSTTAQGAPSRTWLASRHSPGTALRFEPSLALLPPGCPALGREQVRARGLALGGLSHGTGGSQEYVAGIPA